MCGGVGGSSFVSTILCQCSSGWDIPIKSLISSEIFVRNPTLLVECEKGDIYWAIRQDRIPEQVFVEEGLLSKDVSSFQRKCFSVKVTFPVLVYQ